MIYITGDVHCPLDTEKLNRKHFPEQKELTKDDYLIVCGDMGIVWYPKGNQRHKEDLYWQNWFNEKKYTTLFVDGNHENHVLLQEYPVVDFCGGKAHQIADSVFHLMRGEIYTIDGKTVFCFGGAVSRDKAYRTEGISWWPEEVASCAEQEYGLANLEKHGNQVDYIISHCCSSRIVQILAPHYELDTMTEYFQHIEDTVVFEKWFFGHYHEDIVLEDKFVCSYDKIRKLG